MLRPVALLERAGAGAVIQPAVHRVHLLVQRAAEGDVQLLDAAADRQDRHAARDRGADQRQRGFVGRRVVQVGVWLSPPS